MKDIEIKVNHLNVSYDDKLVLKDINIEIPKGCMCAITGPNGAGKSTLLKSILSLVKPLTGTIDFNKDKTIGYVPQKESVNWQFPITVYDVVLMGTYKKLGWFKRPGKKEHNLVNQALKDLEIENIKDKNISELSGGQQQRVFLARMLCQQADIIFLDEPFAGIDKKSEGVIIKILKKLQKEGKTIVVVHHDLLTLDKYFDYLVLINKEVVTYGNMNEVLNNKVIEETYGLKLN